MGIYQNIKKIENELFDLLVALHKYKQYGEREPYKIHLLTIENLNKEYKSITGKNFVDEKQIIQYYEYLWTMR